jgi:hypothetical protein
LTFARPGCNVATGPSGTGAYGVASTKQRPPGNIKAQAKALQLKEFSMFREDQTRTLIEKIDDAIEQAEDLGLALVASILRMARLEVVQNAPAGGSENNRHS